MLSMARLKENDPPGHGLRKRSVAESEGTFVRQLDRLLHRLGDLHLRISLARLPLTALGDDVAPIAEAIVENLRDPCVLGGVAADGSVVAAFLGPRGDTGTAGDREVTARIGRQFVAALHAVGVEKLALLSNLTVAHCWSDESYDVPSLVLDLASERARPRATAVFERGNKQPRLS
jgi:hypothetical protein